MDAMERIKRCRESKKISQKELCVEVKIKQQQYSKYERGINEISIRYLIQII
ncbi:MAG: helix-turn-helix transcriptional regulator [Clostridia bacterium]|nr:helix-turn-helix transcriptional regulator [Clostridia bacterium]